VKAPELLRTLGLSNYEAEVYGALVRVGRAKVQDLARMVRVPRPQIYVALRSLVDRGACTEHRGKVSYYSAVSPAVAFADALSREREELEAKARGVKELAVLFRRPEEEGEHCDFVQVLKGRQIREYMDRIARQAEQEMLVFCKYAQESTPESLEGAVRLERSVLARGVRVRCLYEEEFVRSGELLAVLGRLRKCGEEARVTRELPMNMVIADTRAALFSLTRTREDVTVFVFNHPALVRALRASFEHHWQGARDIGRHLGGKKKRR